MLVHTNPYSGGVYEDATLKYDFGAEDHPTSVVADPRKDSIISVSTTALDSGYSSPWPGTERTLEECLAMHKTNRTNELHDSELVDLTSRGLIPLHALEKVLQDYERAIRVRRCVITQTSGASVRTHSADLCDLPYENYDFSAVVGRCAENIIGYMPIPVGVAGPLNVDDTPVYLPMATTEGALIASTSRGCKAINAGGGARTVVTADSMTRAPVLSFNNISEAATAKRYIESAVGQDVLRTAFNATTRFGRLIDVTAKLAGRSLYLRFSASTGEAMGMNMVGKATEAALRAILQNPALSNAKVESLSGNLCTDKKAAAINWILGRGKSVVAEAVIPAKVVQDTLKCSVSSLVKLNINKNLVGSALAGSASGGFNAHASNIVTAMFLATGQDPAQNVVSSNCMTLMEERADGALYVTVTMPSIEVGTLGGGAALSPQSAMLDVVGVKQSPHMGTAGGAARLASTIAAGVLAGELSLCAALASGDLIKSHMQLNRKPEGAAVAV